MEHEAIELSPPSPDEVEKVRKDLLVEALRADVDLRRVARGDGALDLAIGDTLDRLFDGNRLIKLHCAREKDYLQERLGIPARTGYLLLRLARETKGKELLRRAIACGALPVSKALAIARVAKGEFESAWIGFALTVSYEDLVARVEEAGGESGADTISCDRILLAMSEEDRTVYEAAVEAAREWVGLGAPRWMCQESIAMEWLGGHPEFIVLEKEQVVPVPKHAVPLQWKETRETVEKQIRVLEEAERVAAADEEDPFCVEPEALHARAKRLLKVKETVSEPFGRLLRAFDESGMWAIIGYRSFTEYARDRLGLAPRTVRERVWLERKLEYLPELREALKTGELPLSKAVLVAKHATPADVQERIEEARRRPHEKVERETRKEEERRNSAAGVKCLWGPAEAMALVRESIASAQAWSKAHGHEIDEGKALKLTGAYFLLVWKEHERRRRRRPRSRVMAAMRKDGLCQVPWCTGAVAHLHHIKWRSHQGGDEIENLLGVCQRHHDAVHAGLIRIRGRAGGRVEFEFLGFKSSLETWVTEGDDDTRRIA